MLKTKAPHWPTQATSQSRPMMLGTRGDYIEAGTKAYYADFLRAIYLIVFKVPVWHIIIRGSITILALLAIVVKETAIFLCKKFAALARWIFNGPAKRRERFWKGYASVLGVMVALLGNGIWLNIENDVAWGQSFRAQAPALEQMVNQNAHLRAQLASYQEESGEALYAQVISTEVTRLPVTCSAEQANAGLRNFANFVVQLESKGDQFAVSRSGAVSYTQFLRSYKGKFDRGPMDTGLNRWNSYTERNSIDRHEIWFDRQNLRTNPYRFMGIPLEAQQAFMLVNIAEESGNDQHLAAVACGDPRAAVHLYVYKHHRDPGKEKYIWENVEDKISAYYPNHGLDFSLREDVLKAS